MERIDYKKDFDSLPHSWIIKSLQLIGINNKIIPFSSNATNYWKTSTCLTYRREDNRNRNIEIQCGIFQGDSLSPLLFCISLNPLTEQLNKMNTRYEEHITKMKVSYLFYTDDFKLIGKTEEALKKQM